MLVVKTILELQETLRPYRQKNKTVGLVPTMGNLHEGHLQLVKTAQQHADVVVVSLFVNPTQFGPNEDLDNYPRTFQNDSNKLEALGTDILFAPDTNEIYPLGGDATSHVHVPDITTVLCGDSRPGHFDGVTTVVSKLFNITRADVAIFGEKDYQQLAVIRRMVVDLNITIKIIGEAIVRESDGLAMSSRNGYLSKEHRQQAPELYKALTKLKQAILDGTSGFETSQLHAKEQLLKQGFKLDYLQFYRCDLSKPATEYDNNLVILIAAFLGSTRLIDNLTVNRH